MCAPVFVLLGLTGVLCVYSPSDLQVLLVALLPCSVIICLPVFLSECVLPSFPRKLLCFS